MNPKSILEEITKLGEIAKYNQQEIRNNAARLKNLRDYKNTIDYAFEKGKEQGIAKGMAEAKAEALANGKIRSIIEIAKLMEAGGEEIENIMSWTGLAKHEIESL